MFMGRTARASLTCLRFATTFLPVLAFFLSVVSLVLSAATYDRRLAQYVLPLYPRYQQAEQALQIFQARKYTAQEEGGVNIHVGILDIDDPAWSVMLDFVKSEIAIRKSERNEPGPQMFIPPTSPGASNSSKAIKLPPIDFYRIKTISSAEFPTIKAGTKPLAAPYRLIVFFPNNIPRRVYEFLSFEEFRLDLRQLLVEEVRFGSIIFAACALVLSALMALVRWVVNQFAPQLLVKPAIARNMPTTRSTEIPQTKTQNDDVEE